MNAHVEFDVDWMTSLLRNVQKLLNQSKAKS